MAPLGEMRLAEQLYIFTRFKSSHPMFFSYYNAMHYKTAIIQIDSIDYHGILHFCIWKWRSMDMSSPYYKLCFDFYRQGLNRCIAGSFCIPLVLLLRPLPS